MGKTGKGANQAKKARANGSKRKAAELAAIATATVLSDTDDDGAGASNVAYKRPKTYAAHVTPPPLPAPRAVPPTTPDQTVGEQVAEYVRIFYFRSHKFIQDKAQLEKACKDVWKRLKDEKEWEAKYNLDLASFTEIYGPRINTALTLARQYGQTKGKKAASGKCFCCLLRLTGCLLCLTGCVNPKPHIAPASTTFLPGLFA